MLLSPDCVLPPSSVKWLSHPYNMYLNLKKANVHHTPALIYIVATPQNITTLEFISVSLLQLILTIWLWRSLSCSGSMAPTEAVWISWFFKIEWLRMSIMRCLSSSLETPVCLSLLVKLSLSFWIKVSADNDTSCGYTLRSPLHHSMYAQHSPSPLLSTWYTLCIPPLSFTRTIPFPIPPSPPPQKYWYLNCHCSWKKKFIFFCSTVSVRTQVWWQQFKQYTLHTSFKPRLKSILPLVHFNYYI